MEIVVYALDAGGKNNFAWVRVHKCPNDINNYVPIITPKNQNIDNIIDCSSINGTDYVSGNDLKLLSNLIYNDLKIGNHVAIGVEAPMWFPISPLKNDYRFKEERQSSWSGQIGSTVSVQGIKIILNLFDLLRKTKNITFSTTTEYTHWTKKSEEKIIFLFEGFISGVNYKIPCTNNSAIRKLPLRPINPKTSKKYSTVYEEEHRWDAFLVACAFYGYYLNANLGKDRTGRTYKATKFSSLHLNVFSHWHSIMRRFNIFITPISDCACPILAIE
ncbi:hypothetical protein [Paenibacillus wenxiniae]|uniref:DUF429 domain-containing protein n=1 Tax=Paenibacillus wenxiniae TaxID=1636843 RepID=A0ABW4REN7_9BACL